MTAEEFARFREMAAAMTGMEPRGEGTPQIEPTESFDKAIDASEARIRERLIRSLARAGLPRPLGWLAAHPRLLHVAYKLRPKWRPAITPDQIAELEGSSAAALREHETAALRRAGLK